MNKSEELRVQVSEYYQYYRSCVSYADLCCGMSEMELTRGDLEKAKIYLDAWWYWLGKANKAIESLTQVARQPTADIATANDESEGAK